jgi:TetR/AcrR family transcriptional regulator, mexJK operon transcriptional repressor
MPEARMPTTSSPPTPRRRAGRLASGGVIMDAATTLFLRHGFLGTSVDDIAALAHVSKQTVYTHFADKEQLFAELIRGNIARVDEFIEVMAGMPSDSADVEQHLRDLARRHIRAVIQPRALQLRRLVIGESGRFPELARTYYERVPQRVISVLTNHLQHLSNRGLLHLEDAVLAANHLAWLVLAVPLDAAMFCGDAVAFSPAELDRFADAAVDVFLKAYGRR